jgi:uncharacterized membrane protein YfcA
LKGRSIDWPFIALSSLIGLIGCYFAVLLVTSINERILETSVGIIILILVGFTYFRKDRKLDEQREYHFSRRLLSYPAALILGFYEVILGVGNGVAFSTVTYYTKGFDFIDGLGHYYAISFVWALFSAVLLIQKGYVDLRVMPIAAAGAVLGAYIGSRYAKNKGNTFIKIVFVVVGGILGAKLLLGL